MNVEEFTDKTKTNVKVLIKKQDRQSLSMIERSFAAEILYISNIYLSIYLCVWGMYVNFR